MACLRCGFPPLCPAPSHRWASAGYAARPPPTPSTATHIAYATRQRPADRSVRQGLARTPQEFSPTPSELSAANLDRKSVGSGKSVSVSVDLGGRHIINKEQDKEKESEQ